jgi:hypothetical protein
MTNPAWLMKAVESSKAKAGMLGHVLESYRKSEGLSEDSLLQRLNCTSEVLQELSLCMAPSGSSFEAQVREIANRFSVDARRLTIVIRRVEVLKTLVKVTQDDKVAALKKARLQLAALDRDDHHDATTDDPVP